MTCRQCGTTIADKAIVCYRCGAPTYEGAPSLARRSSRRPTVRVLVAVLVILSVLVWWLVWR